MKLSGAIGVTQKTMTFDTHVCLIFYDALNPQKWCGTNKNRWSFQPRPFVEEYIIGWVHCSYVNFMVMLRRFLLQLQSLWALNSIAVLLQCNFETCEGRCCCWYWCSKSCSAYHFNSELYIVFCTSWILRWIVDGAVVIFLRFSSFTSLSTSFCVDLIRSEQTQGPNRLDFPWSTCRLFLLLAGFCRRDNSMVVRATNKGTAAQRQRLRHSLTMKLSKFIGRSSFVSDSS